MAATTSLRSLVRLAASSLSLAAGCTLFEEPIDVVDSTAASTGEGMATTGTTGAPGMEGTGSSGTAEASTGLEPDGGASTEGSSGATGSSSSGADESSTTESCNPDLPSLHWASDATLVAPMVLTAALYLPGMPQMAYSSTAEAGTITFAFELACPAKIAVQGLVWDFSEGLEPANPDSFYASIDGQPVPELAWPYGCVTEGLGNESWSWQPLASGTPDDCALEPYEVDLLAGPHELTLRNREAGSGFDIAAIAAIVVSEDAELDATTLYDPNP